MAIYLVALHRVLKSRLGSRYVVSEHLGGAILCYLRGIDSPSQGVCSIPASSEMIEALDGSILGSERVQKFSNEKSKTTAFTTHE
jgi:exodeoxyribonuclease V beta subunit